MLVGRKSWGARAPRSQSHFTLPKGKVFLHHTAGVEPDGPEGVRAIQNFHMDARGWSDIGYSFVVDRNGTAYVGRGPGVVGAHTRGHNSTSHAICVMGHYDRERPTGASLHGVAELLRHGYAKGWWTEPALTGGHRDVSTSSCPGENLHRMLDDINRMAGSPDMPTSKYAQAVIGYSDTDIEQGRVLAQTYDLALCRLDGNGLVSETHPGHRAHVDYAFLVGAAATRAGHLTFENGNKKLAGHDRDATAAKIGRFIRRHDPDDMDRRGVPFP